MSIKILEDLGMLQGKKRRIHTWKVQCDCGKTFNTPVPKKIYNCRICANKNGGKLRVKHGDHDNRIYKIWQGIKGRCYNKNNTSYYLYGAKGITMCDEWLHSYPAFKTWALDNGYANILTIDKDELCEQNNIHPKIYSPETCKWKTREENAISNKIFSITDIISMVKQYKNGILIQDIASSFNRPWNSIKAVLIRENVYIKKQHSPRYITKNIVEEILNKTSNGKALKHLLKQNNISTSAWYRAKHKFNNKIDEN